MHEGADQEVAVGSASSRVLGMECTLICNERGNICTLVESGQLEARRFISIKIRVIAIK
jgi:hypothetical protein